MANALTTALRSDVRHALVVVAGIAAAAFFIILSIAALFVAIGVSLSVFLGPVGAAFATAGLALMIGVAVLLVIRIEHRRHRRMRHRAAYTALAFDAGIRSASAVVDRIGIKGTAALAAAIICLFYFGNNSQTESNTTD